MAAAKKKVDRHFYNHDRDGDCVDTGLPAYRWSYEGGSPQEVDLVAAYYGCRLPTTVQASRTSRFGLTDPRAMVADLP